MAVFVSRCVDDINMDAPTTIDSLPNELLELVFALAAEPITTFASPEAARTARSTLLAATLVCRRWTDLAGRSFEQNVCIRVPWTSTQLASYTSRPFHSTSVMFLFIQIQDGEGGRPRISEALSGFFALERLCLHVSRTLDAAVVGTVLRCGIKLGIGSIYSPKS